MKRRKLTDEEARFLRPLIRSRQRFMERRTALAREDEAFRGAIAAMEQSMTEMLRTMVDTEGEVELIPEEDGLFVAFAEDS